MIPQAHIQAWREHAPWPNPAQVEQDLIICRALCDLFNAPALDGKIAFRGGTAIHKLLFKQPLRYSEDIDLVQTQAEPIGPTVDAIRDALAWLGKCNREQAGHSMHLVFRFAPESAPQATLKLKVEINTREHDTLLGYRRYPFAVASDWYSAQAELVSFKPEEIFGTKLRALHKMASGQYAFKAFLIQVANHDSAETLPIQFVQFDKLTDEQKLEFEKFAVMVKWKATGVANAGLLKPGAVVKAVQVALGNPKVVRPSGTVDKFNHATHERCWKRYGVRPPNGSKTPAATQEKFCIYDEPHKDYLYTPAWIEHLVGKMQADGEYESLYKKQ